MKPKFVGVFKRLVAAPVISPAGMVGRAFLIAVLFLVCHLLGWREHTTFLSGTLAAAGTGVSASVIMGLIYMTGYFGLVLLTPILLLASLLLLVGFAQRSFPQTKLMNSLPFRDQDLLRRIRWLVVLFVFGLVLSGVTAIPLETELNWLVKLTGARSLVESSGVESLKR